MKPYLRITALAFLGTLLLVVPLAKAQRDVDPRSKDPQSLGRELQQRVAGFYAALSQRRYDDVYGFLGFGMRRDNPRAEYIEHLRNTIAGVDVGPSDIRLGTTGKNRRPLGEATTRIFVQTREGAVPSIHHTVWVWQPGVQGRPDWFLANDELRDTQQTGQTETQAPSALTGSGRR